MSEFWKRKMKTYFRALDANNDGVITREDYNLFGSRLCERENADPIRRQKVVEILDKIWNAFLKTDEDAPMTESFIIESLKQQKNDPGYEMIFEEEGRNFMNVLDTNEDGFLQEDEYRRLFENIGLANASNIAKISFDAIDTNHDGKLSKDELTRAYVDFMVSEDEKSPFQLFFGPLI